MRTSHYMREKRLEVRIASLQKKRKAAEKKGRHCRKKKTAREKETLIPTKRKNPEKGKGALVQLLKGVFLRWRKRGRSGAY